MSASTIKFRYKYCAPYVYRPIISIELKYKNKHPFEHEVLVDSGADICIFDSQLGDILGIDVPTGEKRTVSGVTGDSREYFLHDLTIKVDRFSHNIRAGFMQGMSESGAYGIVGQTGFFEYFIISFDRAKREIQLKHKE